MIEQFLWLFFGLKGRLSPGAYVLGGLMLLVARMFPLYRFALAEQGSPGQMDWALVIVAVALVTAWCNVALTAKRLHDFGRPATWALIVVLVDLLVFLVLPFFKGDPGPNRYGSRTNSPA